MAPVGVVNFVWLVCTLHARNNTNSKRGRQLPAPFQTLLSATAPSVPLGNVHTSFHGLIVDGAASLVVDDEVTTDAINADLTRSVIVDAHCATHAADIDVSGTV